MPTTYNGVGTHYYGKSNPSSRQGACKHCGAVTRLDSHDTRLWFVVVFIPVIPLGKKRIIDMCAGCKYHYVMDLAKWEEMQQLGISSAKAEYEADSCAEKAIAYHQTLLNFHEHEAAKTFRGEMRRRFEMNAVMHAYLGDTLAEQGELYESNTAYRRAFELKADLPAARLGMAYLHLRARELDEARRMLDFMEQPGAEELGSVAPLETLAIAFQDAGRHEEALELFKRVQQAYPAVAKIRGFRKNVSKSEKKLQRTSGSILPPVSIWERVKSGPMRKWAIGGGVAILIGALAIGQNLHLKGRRDVYLVNGWPTPVEFELEGGAKGRIEPNGGMQVLQIAEGPHTIRYHGGWEGEHAFEFRSGFFARWGDELFLLNPGGRAVMIEDESHYSVNPQPSTIRVHAGQEFERIDRVTHPFKTLPRTISMDQNEKERVLISVEFSTDPPANIVAYHMQENDFAEAFRAAEQLLPAWGSDEDLVMSVAGLARISGQHKRALTALQSCLQQKPVNIPAHRAYERVLSTEQGVEKSSSALVTMYDDMLQKAPDSSALLYLRGRVTNDPTSELDYFKRAVKADAGNIWAQFALGRQMGIEGKWSEALVHLDAAYQARRDNPYFEAEFFKARLALRDHDRLAAALSAALSQDATNMRYATLYAEVLVAKHDIDALKAFEAKFSKASGQTSVGMMHNSRFNAKVQALQGNFDAAFRAISALHDEKQMEVELLILLGRLPEALAMKESAEYAQNDFTFAMAVALAFELRGEQKAANDWIKRAATNDRQHSPTAIRALEQLADSASPELSTLAEARFSTEDSALIAAIIGRRNPVQREAFMNYARERNIRLVFPAPLVTQAINTP